MGRVLDYQTQMLLQGYIEELRKIYGEHLQKLILYGSRARGDFREDSVYDIMILTDLDALTQKEYQKNLSYMTYDFSLDHDVDIKPIAKEEKFFMHWAANYPFYRNIQQEGVVLYDAA